MKKVILTENQIIRLVDKLVINEQNGVKTESLTVPMGSIWQMGYWKLTPQQTNQLVPKLNQIKDFINSHRGSAITIQIEAGESKVTNYDAEDPTKPKLQPGVLSQRRGEEMVNFLTSYFKGLLNNGVIDKMPEIPQPKQIPGTTEYNKGITNLKDPNVIATYQKEQFVNAVITTSKDYECLIGMEISIGYYPGKSSKTHECDEAIFDLRMNGISLGEVNLNNSELDISVDYLKNEYETTLKHYLQEKKYAELIYDDLVATGKIRNSNENKREKWIVKYISDNGAWNPGSQPKLPNWSDRYQSKGYKSPQEYVDAITAVNNFFKSKNRQTDNKPAGQRYQTFVLDGQLAKSIIDRAPANEIVLSIVPLVDKDGKYKMFYDQGSHADTPFVTIKRKGAKENLYNQEPNVGMQRGSTKETVLLRTDLCGNPPNNVNQAK